jgi:peptidoglycan/xylan/chitin deacetylase (PgdA/CDA1 family)
MGRAESMLRALEAIGADRLMRPWLAGRGAVFVLHRAAPAGAAVLDPDLTITADVLDHALRVARAEGYAVVGLDEVAARLRNRSGDRFVAYTFDDGYRDNLTTALPVFRDHRAPVCVYVATGLVDRTASYWWGALAALVESADRLDLAGLGLAETVDARTWREKQAAFGRLESWVHGDLEARGDAVLGWCRSQGVDDRAVLDAAMLTWDELRELARDPLVTIGAHTVTHRRLARLSDDDARRELADSRARLEAEVGRPVRHLAYPFGGPAACGPREFQLAGEAGFVTAVTTRNGNLFAAHAGWLTALPRRRVTEGTPDLRTSRRALTGSQWLLKRGPRVVVQ